MLSLARIRQAGGVKNSEVENSSTKGLTVVAPERTLLITRDGWRVTGATMARKFKFIQTVAKTGAGGSITFPATRQQYPFQHVRALRFRIRLDFAAAGATLNANLWGLSSYLTIKNRAGETLINNVSLAFLDFYARTVKRGLVFTGLDFNDRAAAANVSQEIWLEIPFQLPRLRCPTDTIFPFDEIGDVSMSLSPTAGIGVSTMSGFTVDLYADMVPLPALHMGLQPIIQEFSLDNSGQAAIPFDGAIPLAVLAAQTDSGKYLADAIASGFFLQYDGDQVVDGIEAQTLERMNGLFAEDFYAPQDGSVTVAVAAGYGPWSQYADTTHNTQKFARVYQHVTDASLPNETPVRQAQFKALSPVIAEIPYTRILMAGLRLNSDQTLASRRASAGFAMPMIAKIATDNNKGGVIPPDVAAALPTVLRLS